MADRKSTGSILIVADVEGWAFWNMAQGIAKYADYPCKVVTGDQYEKILRANPSLGGYVAVFHMALSEAPTVNPIRSATLLDHPGWMHSRNGSFLSQRLTTGLRNSWTLQKAESFDVVLCKNQELHEYAMSLGLNAARVHAAVDPDVFSPARRPLNKMFTAGWCGQRGMNQKGYHEILVPLVRATPQIHWIINDFSHKNALSQAKMADFYRKLDVFVVTACAEGGPMPPLEAMACGVPVVGTNVGFLEELPGLSLCEPWQTTDDAQRVVIDLVDMLLDPPDRQILPDFWTWKRQANEWCRAILGE